MAKKILQPYNQAQNNYASRGLRTAAENALAAGVEAGLLVQCEVKVVPVDFLGHVLTDATVTLNGTAGKVSDCKNIIFVDPFTSVQVKVELAGYATQELTIAVENVDVLKEVTLEAAAEEDDEDAGNGGQGGGNKVTFTIIPTPADATVTLNGIATTSLEVDTGTAVAYQVSAPHYGTIAGQAIVNADEERAIVLDPIQYTLHVQPTPATATVTLNGVQTSSVSGPYGTAVAYNVSAKGYVTKEGNVVLESDIDLPVELDAQQVTLTINATPLTAEVTINAMPVEAGGTENGVAKFQKTVPYGTELQYTVTNAGYVPFSGQITLQEDTQLDITLVSLGEDLIEKVAAGGNVALTESVQLPSPLMVTKDTTLNLGTYTLKAPESTAIVVNGGELTIEASEGAQVQGGAGASVHAVRVNAGGKCSIAGGAYTVGADENGEGNSCIYANGGDVVITGGTFSTAAPYNGKYYVLNKKNGTEGSIVCYGGTFEKQNPALGDDTDGGSFVPAGYAATQEGDAYVVGPEVPSPETPAAEQE